MTGWMKPSWCAVPTSGRTTYNKGIRAQILWREDELNTGDLLMVAKNNYFWTEKEKEMDFIANGEIAWCAACAVRESCMASALQT